MDLRRKCFDEANLEWAYAMLSTLESAEDGDGLIVRTLDPTDAISEVTLRFGLPIQRVNAVRRDEESNGARSECSTDS